ncbi:hypothetical protein AVEN_21772-1 [Araneus ventricosus]|uniref:RNase H type-1 domain-containing protein n=1 Tax=Araneus ventricosus TaxID=182803 RepID=A0A4Y2NKC2_ARAVE|nr:hypothetical protein AVEN_21772-1 [Araneus ventricosus]
MAFIYKSNALWRAKLEVAPSAGSFLNNDHRQQFSGYEPVFNDGSKTDNLVGTAVVIRNSIVSGRLHEFCSVFTSEIYAIYSASVKIADGDYEKIIIYSDSKIAIEALRSVSPLSHPIVLKCVEFYLYLTGKGLNILFCWIPGHSGIIGNEMADKAARRPATVVDNSVPLCDALQAVKNQLTKKWQRNWDEQNENKLHEIQPMVKPLKNCALNRKQSVVLNRLRIGHTRLTHKFLLLSEPPPTCTRCQCILSVKHILVHCPNFDIHRRNRFDSNICLKDLLALDGKVESRKRKKWEKTKRREMRQDALLELSSNLGPASVLQFCQLEVSFWKSLESRLPDVKVWALVLEGSSFEKLFHQTSTVYMDRVISNAVLLLWYRTWKKGCRLR